MLVDDKRQEVHSGSYTFSFSGNIFMETRQKLRADIHHFWSQICDVYLHPQIILNSGGLDNTGSHFRQEKKINKTGCAKRACAQPPPGNVTALQLRSKCNFNDLRYIQMNLNVFPSCI